MNFTTSKSFINNENLTEDLERNLREMNNLQDKIMYVLKEDCYRAQIEKECGFNSFFVSDILSGKQSIAQLSCSSILRLANGLGIKPHLLADKLDVEYYDSLLDDDVDGVSLGGAFKELGCFLSQSLTGISANDIKLFVVLMKQ